MRLNYSRALSSRWEFSRVWEGKAEDGQLKQSMAIFGDIAARMQVREEKIRSREMTMSKRKANVRQRQMRRLRALAQWWPVEPR